MTSVKIAELKDHLSEHLRAVERGAEVTVTDRGRPIARIIPIIGRERRVEIRPLGPRFEEVRDRQRQSVGGTIDSLALLMEERAER